MSKQATIDSYIAGFPPETQAVLKKIRRTIKQAVPQLTEGVSYGIPTFYLDNKYLVYFGGFKNHVSVYPVHTFAEPFQKELEKYRTGKGTAQFPLDRPIPYDLIAEIARAKATERTTAEK